MADDPVIVKREVAQKDPKDVCTLLASLSGLSMGRLKVALKNGAVWLKPLRGRRRRIRRATASLRSGDMIELYYDREILSLSPPSATCLEDLTGYSVWNKPAGLLTQGTSFGDHCSLLRQAEIILGPNRKSYPVHRLDREVSGLVLVAHHRKMAAAFSEMFRTGSIKKEYRAQVWGNPDPDGAGGRIYLPIDGLEAESLFRVDSYDQGEDRSRLTLWIKTGRKHQIRRHLAMIGHPILGDPRYGRGVQGEGPLSLTATKLSFICPKTGEERRFRI